ncbi:PF06296 domain protein [Leptospira interrogans serovar Zanoni str. LT2156]|uniref:PF06296 domain protein n=1 Tax=Leptospira interrogans serovar Zanoni str. LT2156 TaxID=1001601 RepID=M6HJS7_LEPIR|nr:PF06296 domain protein [Leptospira interrogans serovar Zanoni str. LT2156]
MRRNLNNSLKNTRLSQNSGPLSKTTRLRYSNRANYYKIRIPITSKGKGKSGGARVISCVVFVEKTVFLVSIYDKSEKENISDKDLEKIIKIYNQIQ